jgi:hypothetical protein
MSNERPQVQTFFDYGTVSDVHKEAANACATICEESGVPELATIIKQRFLIEEPKMYDLRESDFYKLAIANNISVTAGGFIMDDGVRYPYCNVAADIRVLDQFLKKLKNELK